jgi:predicted ester cyclase
MYATADTRAASELIAVDFVDHARPDGPRGPEGVALEVRRVHAAFADIHVAIHEIIVEGDRAAFRFTIEATHVGEFAGHAASHQRVRWTGMDFAHLRDGKFVELWTVQDLRGLVAQIARASSASS